MGTSSLHQTRLGIEEYSAEAFRPYVGEVFSFLRPSHEPLLSGGRVELELVSVSGTLAKDLTKAPSPKGGLRRVPFSLLFVLDKDMPLLTAGLHRLSHDSFEECDWFLSRVHVPGRDPRNAYYEAVFG